MQKSSHIKKKSQKVAFVYGNTERSVHITRNKEKQHFSDMYYDLLSMRWRHFWAWIIAGYFIINLLFGILYFVAGREGITGIHSTDDWRFFSDCFFFSVQTFSTIGYGHFSPNSLFTNIVVSTQALLGLLSIGLTSGLFLSRFTRPTSRIVFSEHILITDSGGKRSLQFRMANSRINIIVNAEVRVTFSHSHITPEGVRMRTLHDLGLRRHFNAIFFLNWVVVHEIDELSPLYNLSHQQLLDMDVDIMASFTGNDKTLSQPIHAAKIYTPAHIQYDRQFEDMLIRDGTEIHVDLDRISELKP